MVEGGKRKRRAGQRGGGAEQGALEPTQKGFDKSLKAKAQGREVSAKRRQREKGAEALPGKQSAKKAKQSKQKKAKAADPLQALLDDNENLQRTETEFGVKVRCELSGHEMPATAQAVEAYLASKKYFKAKNKWYSGDWSQYEPDLVAHKRNPKKLFCNLTKSELNKIPDEVEKHVNGRRFKALKAEQIAQAEAKAAKAARKAAKRNSAQMLVEGGEEDDDGEAETGKTDMEVDDQPGGAEGSDDDDDDDDDDDNDDGNDDDDDEESD